MSCAISIKGQGTRPIQNQTSVHNSVRWSKTKTLFNFEQMLKMFKNCMERNLDIHIGNLLIRSIKLVNQKFSPLKIKDNYFQLTPGTDIGLPWRLDTGLTRQWIFTLPQFHHSFHNRFLGTVSELGFLLKRNSVREG